MSINQGKVNTVQMVSSVEDTGAGWITNDFIIPKGLWAVDTTTGKIKLGNGTSLYSALDYAIESQITPEQRALLDLLFTTSDGGITYTLRTGVNIANAPILADATGKIRHEALPDFLFNTMKIVANVAERDALAAEYHNSPVLVVDATGDTTVSTGGAMYAWYDPDGTGALPESWNKIAEFAEMDTNWTAVLSEHFKFTGTGANTMDDILDGATYVKYSAVEKAKLAGIEAGADVTDNVNVAAAHGMVTRTDAGAVTYVAKVLSAASLKALVAAGYNDATTA